MNDEFELCTFSEKLMATEVASDALGEEREGYVVQICGGNGKQGFPMKQEVLTHSRVHLLLCKGRSCCRSRRTGEEGARLLRDALWMSFWAFSTWSLQKRRDGSPWTDR